METQYPLVFFTLLLCVSAGLIGFQGFLLLTGRGTNKFHQVLNVCELVAIVVGGFASFLHLHHWERIFNGFMHLSSGITQELIGVVVIVLTIAIMFVTLRRAATAAGAEGAQSALSPKWVGVLALVVGIVMGFVCSHSYDMYAKPAWNNITLYLYYYASELVLGATCAWLVAAACKQDDTVCVPLAGASLAAGVIAAVVAIVCAAYYGSIDFYNVGIAFHTTDPMRPALDSAAITGSLLAGENAPLFWGGAVLAGGVVAAVAGLAKIARKSLNDVSLSAVAFICSMGGGIAFRILLYVVAIDYYGYW